MTKILSALYTIATVLIIVGALFILQNETYGLFVLCSGLVLNIVYRFTTLDYARVKSLKILEVFRLANIFLMIVACLSFMIGSDQKFNFLIISIVLDLLLNLKEISFKTK
ncbi:MAG: hypothetical protein JEZ01_02445 [Labilibaculum sp.]|nr:hypothetical protein [Labilibaculum sp.]MBI9056611.1 hypothetical protein [Labilibaculum sp.]